MQLQRDTRNTYILDFVSNHTSRILLQLWEVNVVAIKKNCITFCHTNVQYVTVGNLEN